MAHSNLILAGMKGSGKTTNGKLLSEKLHLSFIDTDEEIKKLYYQKTGELKPIPEIYQRMGEEQFRTLEENVVDSLEGVENCVIALGGGTHLSLTNQSRLKELGMRVCLFLDKSLLYKRWRELPAYLADAAQFDAWYQARQASYVPLSFIWVNASQNDLIEILTKLYLGWQRKIQISGKAHKAAVSSSTPNLSIDPSDQM